jgi:hypothetical protein
MADRVEEGSEIALNSVRYGIVGPVSSFIASTYPEKQIFGDFTRDTNPRLSVMSFSDWTGGIGLETATNETNRSFRAMGVNTNHVGHLILGSRRVATTGTLPGITRQINQRGANLYAAFNTDIWQSTNGTAWTDTSRNLPANPTDSINVRSGGTEFLVFCCNASGFTFFDGTNWTDSPTDQDAKCATWWADRLYLISKEGQLKYMTTLATQLTESGTVSGTETDGSAALSDAAAIFSTTIRDGKHWVVAIDDSGYELTGYIGTTDPEGDSTEVAIFNNTGRGTQNWQEGAGTAFDFTRTITYRVYLEPVDDAQLPLPDNSVANLVVFRDGSNNHVIWALTTDGPWIHDSANARFVFPGIALPRHPDNGLGYCVWRDKLYISSGTSIYEIGSDTVRLMGPGDTEDGIETAVNSGGRINQIVCTPFSLYATVGSGNTIAMLMEWSGKGWTYQEQLGGVGDDHVLFLTSLNSAYRIYIGNDAGGANLDVSYIDVPRYSRNPKQLAGYTYRGSGTVWSPWFTAGQHEVSKLAVRLRVDTRDTTAGETIRIKYAVDGSATWTTLGTITTPGVTTYDFPNSTTPTGTVFRAMRFELYLARGGTNTLSPDMVGMALEYRKKLDVKYGWQFQVDMSKGYGGRSVKELRDTLITAMETETLVEFVFRNNTASGNPDNFYVDVMDIGGLEETGFDETGLVTVKVAEA